MGALQLDPRSAVASPLHGRVVWVLATPESGADQLLGAIGRLPGVTASPAPLHLFDQGLDALLASWAVGPETTRPNGMAELVGEQDFLVAARLLLDAPLHALLSARRAERVVEYTADNIAFADEVAGIYPDAHLVHVVRDGRQVAARLDFWVSAHDAASHWCADQRAVLALDHPNVHSVRIEDYLADPVTTLGALVKSLEIDADDAAIEGAALLGVTRGRLPSMPPGRAGSLVEVLGRDLLSHYAYEPSDAGVARARVELAVEEMVARAQERAREGASRIVPRLTTAMRRARGGRGRR